MFLLFRFVVGQCIVFKAATLSRSGVPHSYEWAKLPQRDATERDQQEFSDSEAQLCQLLEGIDTPEDTWMLRGSPKRCGT